MNLYSENDRLTVMLACCYRAAQRHFSHIAMKDIVEPPREMLDAALARQCALTLMRDVFDVPQRRTSTLVGRNRGRIAFAMWTITIRRKCPVFDQAYRRIADEARRLYLRELDQAEEQAA